MLWFDILYIPGVAGIPSCNMNRTVCDKADDLLALGVYNPFVQDHLAQVGR